jgi:hypothetical protein
MNTRNWNWRLWLGFSLCLAGFVVYLPLARFPVTRDIPWVTFLFFAASLLFLGLGITRAFGDPQRFRGKIFGPILGLISFLVVGAFCFFVFHLAKQLPQSASAPRVGDKAPEFALLDANNQSVSLASLLTSPLPDSHQPPKGVLLVFYRGYW